MSAPILLPFIFLRVLLTQSKSEIQLKKKNELTLRVLSGIPAFIAILSLLFFSPWQVIAVVVVLAMLYGMTEYQLLLEKITGNRNLVIPLFSTLLIGVGGWVSGVAGIQSALVLAMLISILHRMVSENHDLARLQSVAMDGFGLFWIPWSFGHLILILQRPDGPRLVLMLVLVMIFNDTMAFFTGKSLGRNKLMPGVSPNKTIEGSLGGIMGGVAGGWVAVTWLLPPHYQWDFPLILGLSAGLAMVGQVGDLVESMVKRAAGVKDSGRFLPGHGGFLDRLDVFLLAPPMMYYTLRFFL